MEEKKYSNGEITILWSPKKCIHAGVCVKTLPNVYKPKERPWVQPENASTQELIDQVAKCPSGALSILEAAIKITIEDNEKKGRFVIYEDEKFAGEMTYTWAGQRMFIINHTGVEKEFGGKGYGKNMVMKAVEFARSKEVKIIPLCPFAKKVFERNDTIQDVKQ